MDAEKRAAFAQRAKRYIQEKTASREIARRTLIDLGIYTEDGQVAAAYGGTGKEGEAERSSR